MKAVLRLADVDAAGKRVLIRADMNVPLDERHEISDDTRIRASVEDHQTYMKNLEFKATL